MEPWLEHLADANGLTTAQLLAATGRGRAGNRYLTLASSPETIARLAALARVDEDQVYAATLASFDGTALDLGGLDPRDRYWHRQVAARGWTPAHGTQVCPGCLADSGTWKTAWRLLLVNACTDHGVMLTARCPACRRPFRDQRHSHLRTVGAATVCGNPLGQGPVKQCQHDLITLTGSSPPPRVLATQARMNSALAGEVVTVLGRPAKPTAYVTDLRHLTTLLLHLAGQPGADTLAPWVSDLAAAAADGTAARGACPTTSTPPARTECVCRSTCSLSLKSSPTRSTLSTWPAPLPPAKRPSDSSPPFRWHGCTWTSVPGPRPQKPWSCPAGWVCAAPEPARRPCW
ncbi:MAG TPA: hypothetical protein DEG88_06320 [Propionibacteriaceae bacterium]|nr:hypothetical protein [Actinomycetota bacterium]HBX80049.1 hypothetical protein [Propionibacteriaceae bacterium]HBY22899.1 hypothetical protein [Propionibacteriaceae bacterium]